MDRLIIESIEGRIMLGITMFVAVMILVGWVAINEPARMAEFVEQHEGRSIERGAELFAANCSSCHGINGYGIAGRAPALNNPQLFGYSYVGEVNSQIASLQRELLDIEGTANQIGTRELFQRRQEDLLTQLANASEDAARDVLVELLNVEAILSEDTADVAARIAAIESGEPAGDDAEPALTSSELDARLQALRSNIATTIADNTLALNGDGSEENPGLLAEREALLEDLAAARLRGYLPRLDEVRAEAEAEGNPLILTNYITQDSDRLAQISFGGAIEGYVTTTLIHGRPGSGGVWNGNIMVSWSQRAGGPLRDDQIADIVAFIMNWNKGDAWTIDDFNAVDQYAILHAAYTGGGDPIETVGTDVSEILANLPAGDATQGEALYNGNAPLEIGQVVGCSGCHINGVVGPDTIGTWTRVLNQRITLPEFAGYTAEQYLIESIVQPDVYIAPGYSSGVMIGTYGSLLTTQDLADIIAYLQTQNQ